MIRFDLITKRANNRQGNLKKKKDEFSQKK